MGAKAPPPKGATEPLLPTPLSRVVALVALVLGAIGIVGFALGFLFRARIAPVVAYANFGAALLEVALAYALSKRSRAAWAFALAIEGALTIINLFGMPQMFRSGGIGIASLLMVGGRGTQLALLIVSSKEYK